MTTDHKVKYTSEEIIDGYLSRVGYDLHLPKISFLKPEHIYIGLKTKRDSYLDINTSTCFGNRRPNSIFQTKRVVYYYTKYINNSTKQFFDCSLYDVGGRAKRLIKKAIISAFA